MNFQQYNDNAGSIRTRDIVTNSNNRIVLRRIKRNSRYDENNGVLYIQNVHDENGEECVDYVPEGANDMRWLGYFIGKNIYLQNLYLSAFTPPSSSGSFEEVLTPFLMGVNNNRSITSLEFCSMDLFDGKLFSMLHPFFENSPALTELHINECTLGDDGWRLLALAIGSSKHKSLQKVSLRNYISDEGSVDIITALSMHPNLQNLWWNGNRLGTKGCKVLATLLRCSATQLKFLYLDNNEIDDEGIDAMVPALKDSSKLQTLYMNDNSSITLRGWQTLANILEAPNSNHLTTLSIQRNNIDDQAATAFASALLNNRMLTVLNVNVNSITNGGWKAFSNLLCDTTSINATFLSNHTLTYLTSNADTRASLQPLFTLNKIKDKKEVAIIKILQHHIDFDMTPFFEWEFKVLPLMIDWFEKASTVDARGF